MHILQYPEPEESTLNIWCPRFAQNKPDGMQLAGAFSIMFVVGRMFHPKILGSPLGVFSVSFFPFSFWRVALVGVSSDLFS